MSLHYNAFVIVKAVLVLESRGVRKCIVSKTSVFGSSGFPICYFHIWTSSGAHRENLPSIGQHWTITAGIYPDVQV